MTIDVIVYEQNTQQLRMAGLENGKLQEVEIIDHSKASEGNIYLGRITKKIDLVNGRIGFFVDIADSRDAFINAEENGLQDLNACEGQSIIAQVSQEQRAEKGARLVRSLQFVGENLVYCPYKMTVEVSSKIEDKVKAAEYKNLVVENMTGQEGWIVRTSAVNASKERIVKEMEELRGNFEHTRVLARQAKSPALLSGKTNPLFEYVNKHKDSLKQVILNARNVEEELKEKFGEEIETVITSEPFAEYGLDEAISEALQKEVKLKNGGRITIEETKACVAIDVDSGSDNSQGSLGRLNMEAAEEIIRQIRLRNLSGKIIIDFAGISEFHYLKNVLEYMEAEMAHDTVKNSFYGLSRAGNVELVRMRRRPSLRDVMTAECASCQGSGRVEK